MNVFRWPVLALLASLALGPIASPAQTIIMASTTSTELQFTAGSIFWYPSAIERGTVVSLSPTKCICGTSAVCCA